MFIHLLFFIHSVLCLSIREILSKPEFDFELLTRQGFNNSERIGVLMKSDIDKLMRDLEKEFPEMIKIRSIGRSYENRSIDLLEVDARHKLVQ